MEFCCHRAGPHWSAEGELTLQAVTIDSRAILELREREGVLIHASLQLALADQDDLAAIKLRCWTLLFLKALFPSWVEAEQWMENALARALSSPRPIKKTAGDYIVMCHFDRIPGVLDYKVIRKPRSTP